MKHRMSVLLLTALALALSTAPQVIASPVTYSIDRSHTEAGFEVRHFFSKVHGRFKEVSGTIVFDEQDAKNIIVDATAQTASIWTDDDKRDAHLRSPAFFAADTFTTLTFKSTSVQPAGTNKYKVAGNLTMRGVTRAVTFDGEFLGAAAIGVGGQAWGTKAGFTATTVVNRQDYGIKWNKTLDSGGLMLDDKVTIVLNVEANKVEKTEAK